MCMRFAISIGSRSINDMLTSCNMGRTLPIAHDAGEICVKQTIPFIPDDDYIHELEKHIVENTQKSRDNDAVIHSARFNGYKWLYAVKLEESEDETDAPDNAP